MSGPRFATLRSRTVVLDRDDVDTDQIIPARFLRGTERGGYAAALFAGWRYDAGGQPRPDFPLHHPDARDAQVLVAGRNFGCGSSREHAVWALLDAGLGAVVAPSFADIFRANALRNGLLPVAVPEAFQRQLAGRPGAEVVVDLVAQRIELVDGGGAEFSLDPFARHCLLEGIDELEFLLGLERLIAAHERGAGPGPVPAPETVEV